MVSVDASAFDALVEAAETMLSIHDTAFTGSELNQVKYALARQVSYLMQVTPETQLAKLVRRGSRQVEYREALPGLIDTIARSVVTSLGVDLGSDTSFKVVRSLR